MFSRDLQIPSLEGVHSMLLIIGQETMRIAFSWSRKQPGATEELPYKTSYSSINSLFFQGQSHHMLIGVDCSNPMWRPCITKVKCLTREQVLMLQARTPSSIAELYGRAHSDESCQPDNVVTAALDDPRSDGDSEMGCEEPVMPKVRSI